MRARIGMLAALFVLLAALPSRAQVRTCDPSPLVITNVNVWSGEGVRARHDVLVRDGRIARIEPSSGRQPDNVRTIDGTGQTLLPGLIDLHLHFVVPGGLPSPRPAGADAIDLVGRQLLRSGVTAGRVHLASLEDAARLRSRSAGTCEPQPRVQLGGPALAGGVKADAPAFWGVNSAAEAAEKIERLRAAGMQWVGIHAAHRLGDGVLEAIGAAARRAGIRIMGAGTGTAEIAAVLRVDPDTLDYFDRIGEYTPEALASIRGRRNLVLVPTPGIFYRVSRYLEEPALVDHPDNFEFFTDADRAHVLAANRKDLAGEDGERARQTTPGLPRKLRQLRELGLPLALGSDTGSSLHFQGGGIWWELEGWRAFGFSHRDALIAATETAARVLGEKDAGRLAPGARGDFVLYRGDVESGPFHMDRVIAVGKGGVLFVNNGRWGG